MPKYPLAWCPSTPGLVKPEDVTEFILKEGYTPILQCPDEQCRMEHPTSHIVPVCCDPQSPCEVMPRHFRMGPKNKHRIGCPYEEVAEETAYIISHKKQYEGIAPEANLLRTVKGIEDTSLLPDEYIMRYDPSIEFREILTEAEKLTKSGYSRKEAVRMARCRVPQRTSSLDLVVTMRERLQGESPKKVPLSLPGRPTATYANAFFSISNLRMNFQTPYILYGYAKIFAADNGYIIAYMYPLTKYTERYKELCAFSFVPHKNLKKSLTLDLERFSASNDICCVYSFSTHRLNERTCPDSALNLCAVIEPITFDEVVIRKRCVKWSSKRSS